jgi:hypothetical protein
MVWLQVHSLYSFRTRKKHSSTSLQLPLPKTENLKKNFCNDGAKLWNSLPADMRDSDTLPTFVNAIDAYNF